MLIISLPSGAAALPPYEFRGNARERGRRSVGAGLLEIDTRPPVAALRLSSRMESVMVGRMAVFPTGLFVVTTLTKAAPVTPIPEENRISPVRFDVVDHGCLDVPSLL